MKKLISVILVLVLTFGISSTAFAQSEVVLSSRSRAPVIYLSGDSNELTYDNGTKTFAIKNMFTIYGDSDDGNIAEAAFNIMYPLLMKGLLNDDWDDYYEALYNEVSDVYAPILLDKNGDPCTDCDIPQWQKDDLARAVTENRISNGTYGERDYRFYYDWRLDPVVLADQLNDYIEGVKRATGHDKVCITVRCLGCNVLLAYVAKYGTDSIKGAGIDVATSMGAEFLSGMLSGKLGLDGNAIARLAQDYVATGDLDGSETIDFAVATVDLLANTGVLSAISEEAKAIIYAKIEYGLISALARSTFMTFPGYWGMVCDEDFEDALVYVFGEEGSEMREDYAGLIDKITFFNDNIKRNVCPILKKLEDNHRNVSVISKYGVQMVPTMETSDLVGDEYVSANHSSLGATTSTVYGTLSDEYIAEQTEKGLERYISIDKQIDASTCLFPDSTWFIKGLRHGRYTDTEVALMMTVMDGDRQYTVNDFDLTQFMVFDVETRSVSPMTKENCDINYWEADDSIDHPQTKKDKLRSFLISLFKWLRSVFSLIIAKMPNADQ